MQNPKPPTIRAIDVGYGVVKYIVADDLCGSVRCDSFPALAPYAPDDDIGTSIGATRNTVQVSVRGTTYEVGKDADLLFGRHGTHRVLHEQYVHTPEYEALMLGALRNMGEPVIDILVLGLPVKLLKQKAEALRTMAIGQHEFPDGFRVEVREALVMAQPLSGLLDHFSREQNIGRAKDAAAATHLLVDPGFYTLDWVVARGMSVLPEYSSSIPCGMSALLSAIAKEISRTTSSPFANLTSIDEGLRTREMVVEGQTYDPRQHLDAAQRSIAGGLREMQNAVGDGLDIKSVYVMGGGAPYFSGLITQMFPRHQVLTVDDAAFANVRGFQRAGLTWWKRQAQAQEKAA